MRTLAKDSQKQYTAQSDRWRTPQWIGRWCLWTALGVVGVQAGAQPYFISETGGDDGWDGLDDVHPTLPLGNTIGPWQTLGHVQTLLDGGVGNTSFFFERGGLYPGELTVDEPGNDNITFAAYGTGNRPIFTGGKIVPSLQPEGGGAPADRYISTAFGYTPKFVYEDGVLLHHARYPDTGWLETDAGTDAFQLVDADYPGAAYIGSEVVIRCANWQYDKGLMGGAGLQPNSWSVSSVNYLEFLFDGTTAGWGYFLQKRLADCDAPGEWHSDGQDFRVMSINGGVPGVITAAVLGKGLNFVNADNCTVTGIRFEHYTISGIYSEDCTALVVTDCDFAECSQGIGEDPPPPGNSNCQYTGSIFQRCYTTGLLSSGSDALIHGNTFTDIGLEIGLGAGVYGDYRGMLSTGPNVTITENTFNNIGYSAMDVQGSGTIARNYINSALKILNDGGGIAIDRCDGLTIEDNIITGLSANFGGDPGLNSESTSKAYYAFADISFGIYFGNYRVKNTTVQGNTVSGCGAGMHADHTYYSVGNKILRNTFFNNTTQLSISDASNAITNYQDGTPLYVPAYNDEYTGNICYSIKQDQRCLQQINAHASSWAGANPLVDFGTFKDNYYFNPFSDLPVWITEAYTTYDIDIPRTLFAWQSERGIDLNSHNSPENDVEPNNFTSGSSISVVDGDFSNQNADNDWDDLGCGGL